jgi:hypothetical protein
MWLKNRRSYLRLLEAEAESAVREHGEKAADVLRAGVRVARQRGDQRSAELLGQVLRVVRKRSGRDGWVDTATRYLSGPGAP